MDWTEAVELVVARTGHRRYRELCADGHPDRDIWRSRMVAMAGETPTTGPTSAPIAYPPVYAMAGSALAAAGRVAAAAATGGPVRVPAEVVERRRAICEACPEFDARAQRCRLCGCHSSLKLTLAGEACPAGRWGRFTAGPASPADTAGPG